MSNDCMLCFQCKRFFLIQTGKRNENIAFRQSKAEDNMHIEKQRCRTNIDKYLDIQTLRSVTSLAFNIHISFWSYLFFLKLYS